jgi:hypothetical protein
MIEEPERYVEEFSRSFPWLAPVTMIAGTLLSLAGRTGFERFRLRC